MDRQRGKTSDLMLVLVTLGASVATIAYVQLAPGLPSDALLQRQIGNWLIHGFAWVGWMLPLLFAVLALRARTGRTR